MQDLYIHEAGEVRLGSEIVGTIRWAGPCAHYGVAGEWDGNGGTCCWQCGGFLASSEDLEEIEGERDRLAADLKAANVKIEALTQEIQTLRTGKDRADG